MSRLSLYQALRDIATGVIERALRVSGRIDEGIEEAEAWANGEER